MDAVSLTTFLKVCSFATTKTKVSEIEKLYGKPGGYDFYRMLKRVPYQFATGKLKANEVATFMANITRHSEKDHNFKMATSFCNWWINNQPAIVTKSPPQTKHTPKGTDFRIRVSPELIYEKGNETFVTYLWASQSPKLSPQLAGSGVYAMVQALKKGSLQSAKMQILDLRKNKLFDESFITNQSPLIFAADCAQFDFIKKQLGY